MQIGMDRWLIFNAGKPRENGSRGTKNSGHIYSVRRNRKFRKLFFTEFTGGVNSSFQMDMDGSLIFNMGKRFPQTQKLSLHIILYSVREN